jgi:uncharacterized protein with FMN-binding domain
MSKLKKLVIILCSVAAILLIGIILMFSNADKSLSTYKSFNFGNLDLSSVEDGAYIGSEDGGLVKASVEVTVKNHAITNVKILSHDNGKGKPAEAIVDDITEKNSLEVDTISGATLSSYVIKMAVYNALSQKE